MSQKSFLSLFNKHSISSFKVMIESKKSLDHVQASLNFDYSSAAKKCSIDFFPRLQHSLHIFYRPFEIDLNSYLFHPPPPTNTISLANISRAHHHVLNYYEWMILWLFITPHAFCFAPDDAAMCLMFNRTANKLLTMIDV